MLSSSEPSVFMATSNKLIDAPNTSMAASSSVATVSDGTPASGGGGKNEIQKVWNNAKAGTFTMTVNASTGSVTCRRNITMGLRGSGLTQVMRAAAMITHE